MQPGNVVAVLFVLLILIMAGVYASRRNNPNGHISSKPLNDSDTSDITESEPELEIKPKEVDKMDLIPEEQNEKDVDIDNEKEKIETKLDDDDMSDSEEYSMQRMVEEYQKSRTLAKKFAEIIEDISDTFKRKSIEIKRKFEPEAPPAVIRPMSMAEKLKNIKQQQQNNKNKNKKNHNKDKQNEKGNDKDAFHINFDDEKQPEMDELAQKEKKEYIDMDMEDDINYDGDNNNNDDDDDDDEDMVDSEDEFGEFNANNFEDFEDFDTEKIENNNGAIEIITKKEKLENNNIDKLNHEVIEISIEDEKVIEVEQLSNNQQIDEN